MRKFAPLATALVLATGATSMAASPIDIQQGAVGSIGAVSIGVGFVAQGGASARITLADTVTGVEREVQLDIRAQDIVPVAGQALTVSQITGPTDTARGKVQLTAAPVAEAVVPADAVVLTQDGRLRIGGPNVSTATDVSVVSFPANAAQPTTARIEWLPAAWPREATPATSIHQAEVHAGTALQLAQYTVSVVALQQDTATHRARLVLRIQARD